MEAFLDQLDLIIIKPDHIADVEKLVGNFKVKKGNEEIPVNSFHFNEEKKEIELQLSAFLTLGSDYKVIFQEQCCSLKIRNVVRTADFDKEYAYTGNDLGAIYTKEKTTFNVWAPTATEVLLVKYTDVHSQSGEVPMMRQKHGVWSITIEGDLEGVLYTYRVCVNGDWQEAVDPYAKAVSVNGSKGMVVDLSKTNPKGWDNQKIPTLSYSTDAIIYEANIRDFTIARNSGVGYKGKYLGLTERYTKGPWGTLTGLDHLIDLGITHIQIMPFFDFGSIDETKGNEEYNWGYDPLNYNAPEGSYSTDPHDGRVRIMELKKMISALHNHNIGVIMDVVYNHVYVRETSHFERIVPGYYFRYDSEGNIGNGTGVGNDTASERMMMRKFIIDSVTFWAEEYKIDGFRFDLMGIHDIETMNSVCNRLQDINPATIILGEGWNLSTPLPDECKATIENAYKLPKVAHFNDRFRDCLKGNIFNIKDKGFVNGNEHTTDYLKTLVLGSVGQSGLFTEPFQSINFVECHDNHTLWDKLELSNEDDHENDKRKMHLLASSIVLLSQGIPFIHAGQEYFRTKDGVENSYCSPDDINQMNWEQKALHMDAVDYIKGLIAIRKAHPAFRLCSAKLISKHCRLLPSSNHVVAYQISDLEEIDTWQSFIVIHNGSKTEVCIDLPNSRKWSILVDEKRTSLVPLCTDIKQNYIVKPFSTTVLCQ